jgi:hypothetical protein
MVYTYLRLLPVTDSSCNYKMISEWWIWEGLEGSGHGLIKVLSRHLPGGTEGNHEIPAVAAIWPTFKPASPNTKHIRYSLGCYFGQHISKRHHWRHISVDGQIILKWILKNVGWSGESVDCIHLAQDMGQWWDHVDSIFNFKVSQNRVIY